jgi:hypothetical protein
MQRDVYKKSPAKGTKKLFNGIIPRQSAGRNQQGSRDMKGGQPMRSTYEVYQVTSPGGRTTRIVAKNSTAAKRQALKRWGLSTEFLKDCSAKKTLER